MGDPSLTCHSVVIFLSCISLGSTRFQVFKKISSVFAQALAVTAASWCFVHHVVDEDIPGLSQLLHHTSDQENVCILHLVGTATKSSKVGDCQFKASAFENFLFAKKTV